MKDFIIVDTEGKDELNEIAILNSQGKLIYEAFVKDELNSEGIKPNAKNLKDIIDDFLNIVPSKLIICHYAVHDIKVLQNSFKKVGIKLHHHTEFDCTFELAKKHFPELKSYSLDYLSKYLHLKVDKKSFNQNFAHRAKYDALFTYQLYTKIIALQHIPNRLANRKLANMTDTLPRKPNPFGTSRVDSPFQNHVDLKDIYQNEFERLKSILVDIKHDPNHQSQGAVVIGEAGSGKTHLMMRLAKEFLTSHRLLFIRQPNNPQAVLYHIYSRMLESFVEMIPNSQYSQLEYLLARSFSKIIIDILTKKDNITQNGEMILNTLSQAPLNIYQVLGGNTEKKRKSWQLIEKLTLEWWAKTYGFGGYSISIVKGLIKFCSYSDTRKKELVRRWLSGSQLEASELDSIKLDNWSEEISQESFALEAITVFSKLSIVDEPLIIIFDQLEGLKYQELLLLSFFDAVKELFTHAPNSLIILNLFPDRWQHFKMLLNDAVVSRLSQSEIVLTKPTEGQLKEILTLKAQEHEIEIETLFSPETFQVILTQNSIRGVLNWASHYYRYYVEGITLPQAARSFEDEVKDELRIIKEGVVWLIEQMKVLKPQTTPILDTPVIETREKQVAPHKVPPLAPVNHEEYLKDYLTQQQALLEQEYLKNVIINDFDDIGKLITITEAFKNFKDVETDCLRLGKRTLPEHLLIKTQDMSFVVGFLQSSGRVFTPRIKNFNELVINHKEIRFGLFRDAREAPITGKVGMSEIDKLNNAANGKFILMEKEDRLNYELIYKLIIDIQNQDVEIALETALKMLESLMNDYWLIKIFRKCALTKGIP